MSSLVVAYVTARDDPSSVARAVVTDQPSAPGSRAYSASVGSSPRSASPETSPVTFVIFALMISASPCDNSVVVFFPTQEQTSAI